MRKENASFNTKFISESGSYLKNADYFAFVELKDYACYVVADGIDLDDRKESAKLAVTTVIAEFSEAPGISSGKMKRYMKAAHEALLKEASEIRLEASIVILVTDYKKVRWAYAGNSRMYWMRNGLVKACTKDTSLTQRLVDQEELALDQVAYHEERNNLYSYLGQPGRFTPVISKKKLLSDGDILILQTRGVWENVGEAELIDAVDGVSKPEDVCVGLEDVILSQQLNVIENYTIATVFVDKVYINPKAGRNKKIIKIVLVLVILVGGIVFAIMMARYHKNKTNIFMMEKSKEKGITYLQENNYSSAEEQFDKAYETSESISASPNSVNGKKISCVETYDTMAEYINLAFESIQKGNYKDAHTKFASAEKLANTLKEEYGEDISGFAVAISSYSTFTEAMMNGQNAMTLQDYSTAAAEYDAAVNSLSEVGDVESLAIAMDAKNEANAQKVMKEGDDFMQMGMDYYKKGEWLNAEAQFELAKKSYESAKNDYNSTLAEEKIASVDNYIASCDSSIDVEGNSEKIKEASTLEAQGDDYMRDGDYTSALEAYEQALASYQEAGSSDYVIAINEKINKAKNGPAADSAFQTFLKAVDYMADAEYGSALQCLYMAKDAYTAIDDTEMIGIIDDLIIKLQNRTAVG